LDIRDAGALKSLVHELSRILRFICDMHGVGAAL
jgi:hypothetical protein